MNKFNKIVNEILNDAISLPCQFNISQISKQLKLTYKWFGLYEILNEYVEEHELTHFVQRIVGHEKSLKRSIEIPGNGYGLYLKNKQFFDKLFNIKNDKKISNNILEFIKYILKPVQQDTSFKHIVMQFQREYQRTNKEISSFKGDIRLSQNFEQRLNWLNEFLNKFSKSDYFDSIEWKNNLQLIQNNYDDLSLNEKIKYDLIYAIIGYLIYENILPNKNFKDKLINHFKIFKFRDN